MGAEGSVIFEQNTRESSDQSSPFSQGFHSKYHYSDTGTFHLMPTAVQRFLLDESGATAIEYGLIAAGISVAIIAVVNRIGTTLNTKFTSISTQLR
jgi:pilus assembly protein Flp/PilA